MSSFVVKTEEYEGPLDALVTLIEKRKLLINDISLAEVTENYIAYFNSLETRPLDNLSEFISIAATLILIKSKSLLPDMDLSYEEELSIDELKERLKKYEIIRKHARIIEKLYGKNPIMRSRPQGQEEIRFRPGDLSMNGISSTLADVRANLPRFEKKPQAKIRKLVSLREVIDSLEKRAQKGLNTSFNSVVDRGERGSVIVNFLALLELIKQGVLNAQQGNHFDEINIKSQT
ncbi:MAG: segregation/condensation protein A [Candidatus Paceibacterota bacterium]